MIRQPLGCVLCLLALASAVAITVGVFWCLNLIHPGLIEWGFGAYCLIFVVSFIPFFLLLEYLHRFEIRVFFWRRGLRIKKIQAFPNHYRVHYFDSGKAKSGKWPKDFEDLERRTVRIIKLLTVQEILDEEHVQKM